MTELSIDAIMAAMADYAEAAAAEGRARSTYDGYSWDYHGGSYIDAVDRNRTRAAELLRQYIAQEVAEQLRNLQNG